MKGSLVVVGAPDSTVSPWSGPGANHVTNTATASTDTVSEASQTDA